MLAQTLVTCSMEKSGSFHHWTKMKAGTDFIFLSSKITVDSDYSHEIKNMLSPWKETYDKPRQHIKKQRHHLVNKDLYSQSPGFTSSHVWM